VLYREHTVANISRNDASAINLIQTTKAINDIIEKSKKEHRKSICFITGVPGAGKTLAGLNIANERHKFDEDEHAVFLSGNKPLVDVLHEALAEDKHNHDNVTKKEALKDVKAFIQMIHHFRDDTIATSNAPIEKVIIFDEAQRAWTKKMLSKFMSKRSKHDFPMSEPKFLINVMDRHDDWAVIICLIGGGQEINTGEAGLIEWFNSLRNDYPNWDVYLSNKITDSEYTRDLTLDKLFAGLQYTFIDSLHLAVSLRSFRSEKVASFVKALLDVDQNSAKSLYSELCDKYPILLTRSLDTAKKWVKSQAKGSERYGVTASSGAKRLRSDGLWVQYKIDNAANWFLKSSEDVRSSYFLEETATEFDIQGLELDWSIVCWDANFRFIRNCFEYYNFRGTEWTNINNDDDKMYLKNAYRVLLTRARQGMIIYIPSGCESDQTRLCPYYDGTYQYLKEIGLQEI
jgi:hypothetical protein